MLTSGVHCRRTTHSHTPIFSPLTFWLIMRKTKSKRKLHFCNFEALGEQTPNPCLTVQVSRVLGDTEVAC